MNTILTYFGIAFLFIIAFGFWVYIDSDNDTTAGNVQESGIAKTIEREASERLDTGVSEEIRQEVVPQRKNDIAF